MDPRIPPVAAVLALAACASPPTGLWPAGPGERTTRIIVSSDSWHSMIAIPVDGRLKEWGYAEKAWYLEGKQGSAGVVRALLWPTDGVIEASSVERPWFERSTQGGGRWWVLDLGDESMARLKAYLEGGMVSSAPIVDEGWRKWYDASSDYHLFHTCHHWVAHALWEAGVPVYARQCWIPRGLWEQMDRLRGRELQLKALRAGIRPAEP